MYQAPNAELHREKMSVSPRSIWLRLPAMCGVAIVAPVAAVLLAKQVAGNHNIWSLAVQLSLLPLCAWVFAARGRPRQASRSAAILAGIVLAACAAAFVGLLLAFPVGLLYQPSGALLPPSAGA